MSENGAEEKKRYSTAYLGNDLRLKLKRNAAIEGISMQDAIREAVENWLAAAPSRERYVNSARELMSATSQEQLV